MEKNKVLLIGDLNIDNIVKIPVYPAPGGDAIPDRLETHIGGAVANTAFVLDKLDQPAKILSSLGKDVWADVIKDAVSGTLIDLSQVIQTERDSTGMIIILVTPDGERTMFSYRGANTCFAPEDINPQAFQDVGIVHISGYALLKEPQRSACYKAIKYAEELEIPISIDIGLEPAEKCPQVFKALLPKLTFCITGMHEPEIFWGCRIMEDAASKMLASGVKIPAIKLGADGCYIARQSNQFYLPPFDVKPIDTTGAGDAFSAGLLFGFLQRFSLRQMGLMANLTGALATQCLGAGNNLPGKEEISRFIVEFGSDLFDDVDFKHIYQVMAAE